MKYVKVLILIYCFTQLAFCMCRNLSAGKAGDSISGDALPAKTVRKEDIMKAVKKLQPGELLDSGKLVKIFPLKLIGLDFDTLETHPADNLGTLIVPSQITYKKGDQALYYRVMDIGEHPEYLNKLAAWSLSEFDHKQPDGGYEKSMVVNGDKTLERYDPVYKVSTLSVIYDDRIVVTIFGTNLSVDQLHSANQ